jgi:hypothetical protein
MKEEIKELWINALRSGKYVQGKAVLVIPDEEGKPVEACCLGVLCDLAIQHGLQIKYNAVPGEYVEYHSPERRQSKYPYGEDDLRPEWERWYLPSAVAEWAGLEDCTPEVYVWDVDRRGEYPLHELNDEGMSFQKIADLIEEQL